MQRAPEHRLAVPALMLICDEIRAKIGSKWSGVVVLPTDVWHVPPMPRAS
jgi:hypothetical protein